LPKHFRSGILRRFQEQISGNGKNILDLSQDYWGFTWNFIANIKSITNNIKISQTFLEKHS
jgi:hypothetical protein